MSALLQLQIAIWFTGMCVIVSFSFLGWLIWQIFWDAYDHFMGFQKRKANNRRVQS